MELTGSNVDIDAELLNQTFLLAELNEKHQLVAVNALLQQIMGLDVNQALGTYVEQHFSPFTLPLVKQNNWQKIWDIVEQEGQWQGYMQSTTSHNIKISATVKTDGTAYYFIAQDLTKQISHVANELYKIQDLTYLKAAFDEATIITFTDKDGIITYVNDKFCDISKYDRSELIGNFHSMIRSEDQTEHIYEELWQTIRQGKVWRGELKNRDKEGSDFWLKTTIVPFLNEHNEPYQYVSIHFDITDRIIAETKLAETMNHDFRRTIRSLQNCVFKVTRNKFGELIFTLSEGKLAEQLGITTEQVEGKPLRQICNAYNEIEHYYEQAFDGETHQFELQHRGRYFLISLSPVIESEQVTEVVASMIEVTQRKRAEELIRYMAHYDPLTGLPNRTSFLDQLEKAIARAQQLKDTIAIMFIDLDRFKTVNETMGIAKGDELLMQVAQRLQRATLENGYIARNGGDEFTVYIEHVDRVQAAELARAIIEQLAAPYLIDTLEIYVSPSIGISMYPNDGIYIEQLIKCADAAMFQAKEDNRSQFRFYNEELHQQISQRLELERDLRKAVEQGEFELWYQPKVKLCNHRLIGMEVLLRWNHPKHGLVPPGSFIHIAEETNLIIPIGEWVLREACRQMKQWLDAGMKNISVAVNISFKQFADKEFPELVAKLLQETGLEARYLELEITESVAQNVRHAIDALKKIKELGVSVSIDDFGTGYSSLSSLSQLPIDRLKIDQSFVRNLNASNQAIIRSILDIANHMNITVIAEGVETKEQVIFLQQHRCQEAQGYYYSKPLPRQMASEYMLKLN